MFQYTSIYYVLIDINMLDINNTLLLF